VGDDRVAAFLGGRWLGHALHPLLTDLPIGSWTSASLLDVVGGRAARPAARRLIAFGVATAVPTALAGLVDWRSATPEERRVGVIHAGVNASAVVLYGLSLVSRRQGHHARGVLWAAAGGLVATGGGYLGGHLAAARDTALRATASSA
jgi:uncharacterized membrane protein